MNSILFLRAFIPIQNHHSYYKKNLQNFTQMEFIILTGLSSSCYLFLFTKYLVSHNIILHIINLPPRIEKQRGFIVLIATLYEAHKNTIINCIFKSQWEVHRTGSSLTGSAWPLVTGVLKDGASSYLPSRPFSTARYKKA